MNKKQQKQIEEKIKSESFTTFVYWIVAVLGIVLILGGMAYSYTALSDLAAIYSYGQNSIKALAWPLFSEGLLLALTFLVLLIKLKNWEGFTKFRNILYFGIGFVIFVNLIHTNLLQNWKDANYYVKALIELVPIFVYIGFLESGFYLVGKKLNEKVESEIVNATPEKLSNNAKINNFDSQLERATQTHVNNSEEQKHIIKSFMVQLVDKGLQFTQEELTDLLQVSRPTLIKYFNELTKEESLVKTGRNQFNVNGNSENYLQTDVSKYWERLEELNAQN